MVDLQLETVRKFSALRSGTSRGSMIAFRGSKGESVRMDRPAEIIQRISRSEIYKDYERAFSDSTELPLALRPVEIWNLAMSGDATRQPILRVDG